MRSFLIQIDGQRNFLTRVAVDGSVHGSPYPSFAAVYDYEQADRLARRLRDQGYELAVVTDKYGKPVSAEDLDSVREAEALPEFYSVRLNDRYYFVRLQQIQGKWQVINDLREINACGLRQEDAERIVENLKALGHADANAFVNSFYDENTVQDLDEVWPGQQ